MRERRRLRVGKAGQGRERDRETESGREVRRDESKYKRESWAGWCDESFRNIRR